MTYLLSERCAFAHNQVYHADTIVFLRGLPDDSINCCISSPPYFGLRDYGTEGQIGLEKTPEEYIDRMVEVYAEVYRVLRPDGTCWLNLGDSYSSGGRGTSDNHKKVMGKKIAPAQGLGRKKTPGYEDGQLLFIPHRVAMALQKIGWIVRSDIVWSKGNAMPESVRDRPTRSHEYVFLMIKSTKPQFWVHRDMPYIHGFQNRRAKPEPDYVYQRRSDGYEVREQPKNWSGWKRIDLWRSCKYYFDADAIAEPARDWGKRDRSSGKYTSGDVPIAGGRHRGLQTSPLNRNKRSVWNVNTRSFRDAHFAVFPPKLIEPMIRAGCPAGGVVLDPFMGSGTTALVARSLGRQFIGCDINFAFVQMARRRLAEPAAVSMFDALMPEAEI